MFRMFLFSFFLAYSALTGIFVKSIDNTTESQTNVPTSVPTNVPTLVPSAQPTSIPTLGPTSAPWTFPSSQPSGQPPGQPSGQPSCQPSCQPTMQRTGAPSTVPSGQPSSQPTMQRTGVPSIVPSSQPSSQPTVQPTNQPTANPSCPSSQPSGRPSVEPSAQPSETPSQQPISYPSAEPSSQPTREDRVLAIPITQRVHGLTKPQFEAPTSSGFSMSEQVMQATRTEMMRDMEGGSASLVAFSYVLSSFVLTEVNSRRLVLTNEVNLHSQRRRLRILDSGRLTSASTSTTQLEMSYEMRMTGAVQDSEMRALYNSSATSFQNSLTSGAYKQTLISIGGTTTPLVSPSVDLNLPLVLPRSDSVTVGFGTPAPSPSPSRAPSPSPSAAADPSSTSESSDGSAGATIGWTVGFLLGILVASVAYWLYHRQNRNKLTTTVAISTTAAAAGGSPGSPGLRSSRDSNSTLSDSNPPRYIFKPSSNRYNRYSRSTNYHHSGGPDSGPGLGFERSPLSANRSSSSSSDDSDSYTYYDDNDNDYENSREFEKNDDPDSPGAPVPVRVISGQTSTYNNSSSSSSSSRSRGSRSELPPGWREMFDDNRQRRYYVNLSEKRSQWRRPRTSSRPALPPPTTQQQPRRQYSPRTAPSALVVLPPLVEARQPGEQHAQDAPSKSPSPPPSPPNNGTQTAPTARPLLPAPSPSARAISSRTRTSDINGPQIADILPEGWRRLWSEERGRYYYANKAAGVSQWKKPAEADW